MERIIGIDPGFGRIGYGIIEKNDREWTHVAHGCIETSKHIPFTDRLLELRGKIRTLIETYHPSRAAVEELFFYKNVKTAIDVGQARGVILVTLAEAKLPIDEFTPLEIKQAISGYGRAEKRQIQTLIGRELKMKEKKIQDDAADALAVAFTAGVSLAMKHQLKKHL